jgi:hypothetical protein
MAGRRTANEADRTACAGLVIIDLTHPQPFRYPPSLSDQRLRGTTQPGQIVTCHGISEHCRARAQGRYGGPASATSMMSSGAAARTAADGARVGTRKIMS